MDPKKDYELDSNGGDDNCNDFFLTELPDEENSAPLPPETIAASFEVEDEAKPNLTGGDTGTDEHMTREHDVVASFPWNCEAGGGRKFAEDDETPPRPGVIAASYESMDDSDWKKGHEPTRINRRNPREGRFQYHLYRYFLFNFLQLVETLRLCLKLAYM